MDDDVTDAALRRARSYGWHEGHAAEIDCDWDSAPDDGRRLIEDLMGYDTPADPYECET